MNKIFEIASNISTPLALSGFIAAILFLIFRKILSLSIFSKLAKKESTEIIKRIIFYLFILAVISMILGFFGYILKSYNKPIDEENSTLNTAYQESLFQASQELRYNTEYLEDVKNYINNDKAFEPVGTIQTQKTMLLLNKHYESVTRLAYGEQKDIYQLATKLNDIGNILNGFKSRKDYKKWNATYEMTIDDVRFLCGFLYWYIGYMAKEDLKNNSAYAIKYNLLSEVFSDNKSASKLKMRYFIHEGKPIIEYTEYLGLID